MQLVYFWATRPDHVGDAEHREMVAAMRSLAERNPGFVEWRDADDGLTYWGVVVFVDGDAALAWRDDPQHVEIHRRAESGAYSAFGIKAFELVRRSD